jgi:hypothetical protein
MSDNSNCNNNELNEGADTQITSYRNGLFKAFGEDVTNV